MSPLPRRPFGSTGFDSSRVIFGAAALMANDARLNDRALALLLEHGVNHIDVAASYGNAELAVGSFRAAGLAQLSIGGRGRRPRIERKRNPIAASAAAQLPAA